MGTAAVGAVATAAGTRNNRAQRRHPVPAPSPSQKPHPASRANERGGRNVDRRDYLEKNQWETSWRAAVDKSIRELQEGGAASAVKTAAAFASIDTRISDVEAEQRAARELRARRKENAPEGVRGWMMIGISIAALVIASCSVLVTVLPHLALH